MGLDGKNILLGVTGGIAAYKVPHLVRLLVADGALVRVVMTSAARQFVAPTALEVVSRHAVHSELFERSAEFPVLHVGLGEWADVVLIAPTTANVIGKMANGIGDDLLTSVILTTVAPVIIAPAMEEGMLQNARVQRNVHALLQEGVGWIEPETGELASGATGRGRMASPETIVGSLADFLDSGGSGASPPGDLPRRRDMQGVSVLVTAGPTCEDIDPVRFISNRSTGKMGYAVAAQALRRGADVILISGPTQLQPPPGVDIVHVRSTEEMRAAALARFEGVNVAIMAAAVSDYRVATYSDDKIKRSSERTSVELVANPDISAELGHGKSHQIVIGFALETEDGEQRAREKLRAKKLDLIALNNLRDEGAGFAVDTNVVTLIDEAGRAEALPKMSKREVAERLLDRACQLVASRGTDR